MVLILYKCCLVMVAIITLLPVLGVAEHYFYRHCGIKPFYKPRSNPDGMDELQGVLTARL